MTKVETQARQLIQQLGYNIIEEEGVITIEYTDNEGNELQFVIWEYDSFEEKEIKGKALTDQWRDALQHFTS